MNRQFIKEGIQTAINNTDISTLFVMIRNRNLRNKVPLFTYWRRLKFFKKYLDFTRECAGGGWKGVTHIKLTTSVGCTAFLESNLAIFIKALKKYNPFEPIAPLPETFSRA